MANSPVFFPGESQGRGSLVGCRLWGRTESGTTEATQQQQQQSSIYLVHRQVPLCGDTNSSSLSRVPCGVSTAGLHGSGR